MAESMAYPQTREKEASLTPAQNAAAWVAALALGIFFLGAGIWKSLDPLTWATIITNMKVPAVLSQPFTVALATGEIFSAILLLIPRFRRWGALLTGAMLLGFMGYVGWNYTALKGMDCSCFPGLKRAINPEFFWSDGAMLIAAAIAGWWAKPSTGVRPAALLLAAVTVFSVGSYIVTLRNETGVLAPETAMVNGAPVSLREGKVLLYFFDPMCSHCNDAAKEMSKHTWLADKVIGIPTALPQYGQQFMDTTKLKGVVSNDIKELKKVFPFGDPPFAVALERGRAKAQMRQFDKDEPTATLRKLGFIQ
ncbi:MAG: hypothetical protein K2X03_13530 [Bryobacteraceae bacterium]|nr:hypothetical protein [Bryobacteraceae bacterium]